jgi:hypothetical protein
VIRGRPLEELINSEKLFLSKICGAIWEVLSSAQFFFKPHFKVVFELKKFFPEKPKKDFDFLKKKILRFFGFDSIDFLMVTTTYWWEKYP